MAEQTQNINVDENGNTSGTDNGAKSGAELAGDSKQRVYDGTKEGGIITQDLVDGKKAADALNKKLGTPGY